MALGLTQPLTEMSTRNISWGGGGGGEGGRVGGATTGWDGEGRLAGGGGGGRAKGGRCVGLTDNLTTFMC
jgi:hypothetical protein